MKKLFIILLTSLFLFTCSTSHVGRTPSSVLNCNDLIQEILQSDYFKVKKEFNEILQNQYSAKQAKNIQENLEALLFIDYNHSINELFQIYSLSTSLSESGLKASYSSGIFGFMNRPFKNHLDTTAFLMNEKPDFSFKSLKEVHARMMSGGVDNIPLDAIGKTRRISIFGRAEGDLAVDEISYQELLKNDYVDVSRLTKAADGKYYGLISYSNVEQINPNLLEKIKGIDPALHDRILAYQTSRIGNLEELTEQMVNALVEDLMSWFVREKDQLGDIDSVAQLKKFIRLVAEFQKNLISIHPFRDGNGRSVRQFALYYPFWLEGLPAPRLVDVNSDLFLSVDEWADRIASGVKNSLDMYKQMSRRLEQGYPIESTPELFSPDIPNRIKISYKKGNKVTENYKDDLVDPGQFTLFYAFSLSKPEYASRVLQNMDEVHQSIMKDFESFYKRSHLFFEHEKNGREKLGLNFVDVDFMASFANKSFKNIDMYNFKMQRWYSDETIWRGLSRQDKEIQESEIVSMFSNVHYQFSSNAVMGRLSPRLNDAQVRNLVFQDFNRYNTDLFQDKLTAMAKDHSESGPMYGQSYGYSTSKNRTVGKAFAMGAMVIAPYGKHHEMQHLLKSRVLVGMKRAKKDVDLTRLKHLRNDFSYKYGRQQEVMGIGAADPDSVDFVQLIDADGGVITSYVRNPKKPSQILVFDGEVSSLKELPENPIRVIDLN
ncbi:MAG: hypothetical protein Fur0010_10420 [Bdellovibrio sp.]